MPAGVPQHMRVAPHVRPQPRAFLRRWTPFAAEHECAVGLAAQLTERSQLIALDRMDRRDSALQSPDMQMRAGEVDLFPFARWRPSRLMPLAIDLSACGDQYFQHNTQLWKVLKLFVCSRQRCLIRGRALAGVKTKSFEVAYPHPQNWLRARNAECARKMCEVLKGGPNKKFLCANF